MISSVSSKQDNFQSRIINCGNEGKTVFFKNQVNKAKLKKDRFHYQQTLTQGLLNDVLLKKVK